MMIARLWTGAEIGYWVPFTEGESFEERQVIERGEEMIISVWVMLSLRCPAYIQVEIPN